MRNVWKGLIVGGLTGVCAGIVLDGLTSASQQAREMGRAVARKAPSVAGQVSETASRESARVRESDLAARAEDLIATAQRISAGA